MVHGTASLCRLASLVSLSSLCHIRKNLGVVGHISYRAPRGRLAEILWLSALHCCLCSSSGLLVEMMIALSIV